MYKPGATYRIQFHKDFNFSDFEKVIPYLHQLGIRTVYASPIFCAVKGSTHGYDGTDPNKINPEIGTLEQFRNIAAELKKYGIGWLQDFAPNHMAFSPENSWLVDYLEKGKMSAYDTFFDKNPDEPLMVPFLGSDLDDVLTQQQLKIVYQNGKLQLQYFDSLYPLNYTGYFDVLNHEMFDGIGFEAIRAKVEMLSQIMNKEEFNVQWLEMLQQLHELCETENIGQQFNDGLDAMNNNEVLLRKIIDLQFYRLCYWKETNYKINYRRFFTVNGLICLNMQLDAVFDEYHQLLHQLVSEDLIQGIRVDHIDGLYDPGRYLKQLRALMGKDVYIVVEKILASNESLSANWGIQGSSGYDFLAKTTGVLTNTAAGKGMQQWYERKTLNRATVKDSMQLFKEHILTGYMRGEWDNLYNDFRKCLKKLPEDISEASVKTAIAEMLICCPVYRFYFDTLPFENRSAVAFEKLIALVKERGKADDASIALIHHCFTDAHLLKQKSYKNQLLHFWRRCMQMTGPLMAKGVEDTFMYNYALYLAQNEVGDSPARIGITADAFHKWMGSRQKYFPYSMNATETHDTKRGEDGRARLQLLSYNWHDWIKDVDGWLLLQHPDFLKLSVDERYFVLQSVYAAFNLSESEDTFKTRLKDFLMKAAREAKLHSNWDKPNEAYEELLYHYAVSILDHKKDGSRSVMSYIDALELPFRVNALVQLTLKCTCPGTPDFYQGSELWDFSFVDPDNRRPVDYEARQKMLDKIRSSDFKADDVTKGKDKDAIKMFASYKLLQLRKLLPKTFDEGLYQPIDFSEHYISYIRRFENDWVIVALPLGGNIKTIKAKLILPDEAPKHWINIFTEAMLEGDNIHVNDELKQFPVLVLRSVPDKTDRRAGVLLPLFSLPSKYGIGGLGQEAYDFVTFLSKSKQRIWQQLPLSPTLKENFYSPYASSSSFAGDPVYIDPEILWEQGWINEDDLHSYKTAHEKAIDYASVKHFKETLLHKGWQGFKEDNENVLHPEFQDFCEQEARWLDTYVLYVVVKKDQNELAWYKWPRPLMNKEPKAIAKIERAYIDELRFQKWMQFLFFKQWYQLKQFAHQLDIMIMGDLPFYVSYDSADIWANRKYFNLKDNGELLYTAGVPPDYFSATGQAWGMPTYNWKIQSQHSFDWWIHRLEHQVKLFDWVRLDHFRAFYDYWEIAGDATDAIYGEWHNGPQDKLFDLLLERFPDMPFVAEDLGEMHQGVFDFRDKYKLMGMRVLQFGFDHYKPTSNDVPHNFKCTSVAYTGTHDNNTLQGWYKLLNAKSRKDLEEYTGIKPDKKNVAEMLINMAYGSVSRFAIIPLQDILNLDETNRINVPSTVSGNWVWRLQEHQVNEKVQQYLLSLTIRYNR